ncbi:ABC transporter permease [Zunongwangia sp. F363]|uniref:ABC transporter permease n=1 Tax=Autumnicola tepida TaxID=3075595 RepID=A0ABU3CDX1_9FLAO|nr:ABC transporter permease [Zunongwangia sp. F363]MDT0644544.1 ABC transporter permease [Zunongwangia sp. F363]
MIRNYFKIAWRNIRANKLLTVLNIVGLGIGLCVCIILFASVSKEFSFDRMYANSEDIYRVNMQTSEEYNYETWATMPNAVGPALASDIPQVKSMTRLIKDDFGATASLKIGDENFSEKKLYLADSTVFEFFDFQFTEGSKKDAFSQPNAIVISESSRKRLFGENSAYGKMIIVNNRDTLHVSGVYQDLPENSVVDCNMVYNIMDSWMGKNVYWSNASYETYVQLQPNAAVAEVQKQATDLIDKYVDKDGQYFTKFTLQPLTKIHLYSKDIREGYSSRLGNIGTIKSLLFLAILVLLIACINYMNLATAHSQKRSKGIGMNKVLGATKGHMQALFYTETGILVFIAVLLGYAVSFLVLPIFQRVLGTPLNYSDLYTTTLLGGLLVIGILVTIIAGSYPAISMSSISPLVLVNKSKDKNLVVNIIRKGLVVFQFSASIILIIAVIVIYQQMNFIQNKDIGYNPNGLIAVSVKSEQSKEQVQYVMQELENKAAVKNISLVQSVPGENESGRSVYKLSTDTEGLPVSTNRTEGNIVETMQLKLLAGQQLPKHIAQGDSTCYTLINEKVMNYLGFKSPQDAVGKYINTEFNDKSIVSGVVKDFNYNSLKENIGGYMYYKMEGGPEAVRTLLIRYNTANIAGFMQQLQQTVQKDLPNTAFDYQFLNRHVANLYVSEQRAAKAATVFTLLAILIACLGLFGLAAFTAEQRVKEIGVRKVLGASVTGVVSLLTKDFLKLVFIALALATPIAWWIMHEWLLDFVYRTHIHWWVFIVAGLVAIGIALLTISFQAIKAAIANPVKSLRTE